MEESAAAARRRLPLVKQNSWSPDTGRDETWNRRRGLHLDRARRAGLPPPGRVGRSVTDDDLDELRGCIDLGFGFEIEGPDGGKGARRLAETFPALDLYYAVRRSYREVSDSSESGGSSPAGGGSPLAIFTPGSGEDPEAVKARLKQWAQAVACAVRQQR